MTLLEDVARNVARQQEIIRKRDEYRARIDSNGDLIRPRYLIVAYKTHDPASELDEAFYWLGRAQLALAKIRSAVSLQSLLPPERTPVSLVLDGEVPPES